MDPYIEPYINLSCHFHYPLIRENKELMAIYYQGRSLQEDIPKSQFIEYVGFIELKVINKKRDRFLAENDLSLHNSHKNKLK